MPSHVRPVRRVRATAVEWVNIRAEKLGPCRVCPNNNGFRIELHHLVPKGMGGTIGGDDLAENLVPLCLFCHRLVEDRNPWACTLLGASLTESEREYVLRKKGSDFLARRYGVAA